jgi:peptidoglycan/LPS O-acetylase OafA/YrhL
VKRIPTLDGWRGIAIALVLFDHIQYAAVGGYLRPWTQTGRHGVTVFFVLSGFLITSNLIAEPTNLRKFYIRRFFRLMPAAWAFLIVLALLADHTGVHLTSWSDIQACLLFYRNFTGPVQGTTAGHFWSLSIEEQFYLVWPFLLLVIGVRRSRWIASAAAGGIAFFRWGMWQHYQDNLLANRTEVRADAILVGCLLALLLSNPTTHERAARWSKWGAVPAFSGLILAIMYCHLLQPLWESICIAVLLLATMLHPDSAGSQILSWKPLAWLGTVSYSLYLWQELFVGFSASPLILTLSVSVALPLFAMSSYYLIERPSIRLGHRLTTVHRPKPSDLASTLVPAHGTALSVSAESLGTERQFPASTPVGSGGS